MNAPTAFCPYRSSSIQSAMCKFFCLLVPRRMACYEQFCLTAYNFRCIFVFFTTDDRYFECHVMLRFLRSAISVTVLAVVRTELGGVDATAAVADEMSPCKWQNGERTVLPNRRQIVLPPPSPPRPPLRWRFRSTCVCVTHMHTRNRVGGWSVDSCACVYLCTVCFYSI